MSGLVNAFRHGLLVHRVIQRLGRVGLKINPVLLFREGVQAHDMIRPDLAAEYSSPLLTSDDLSAVAACTTWNTEESLQARLNKGHLCFVLKHGDRVVGHTWADLDEVNDSACDYSLRSDEAYLYDTFIAPDFRGRGLAPYLAFERYKHLRRASRNTFYSTTDYFNTPAIRLKQKLQAEIIRLYLQIKVGKWWVGQWLLKDYR